MPEFLFRPGYDERHRLLKIRRDVGEAGHIKKGIREPLLCSECEAALNTQFEQPVHRLLYDPPLIPSVVTSERFLLSGLDYATFKLFHLSILWRASVARHELFRHVQLGPYEEVVRGMLRSRTPGPARQFQIFGSVLVRTSERLLCDGVITQAIVTRLNSGPRVYWMVFGGACWNYVVGSHPLPEAFPYSLSEAGTMELAVTDILDLKPFSKFMSEIRRPE